MATIKIMAIRHSAFYAPLLMTIKGGYLEKQGLQPEYQLATPDNPIEKNLLAGTAHLSQSAPAVSFKALEQGQQLDIVHFAAINNRDGFYLTAREPLQDFQWRHLHGQQVLVDHLFQPYATLRYVMHIHAADFDQVDKIDAGDVDAIDRAFRQGQGSFVHQQGPAPQQLEKDGKGHIVASIGEALGPIAFSSLCATREWLQTDMARSFLHAYQQAMDAVVDMPSTDICKLIHPMLPDIDQDVLTRTLDDYKKLKTWDKDISIDSMSYKNLLKVFLHSGYITRAHPQESCVLNLA